MISNFSSLDEEIENLNHEDLCEITHSTLRRLLASDPLLSDLPGDVTNEEVVAQIAVLQGQSITVFVSRNFESPLAVVIPQQGSTVLDLKKSIQRSFELRQQRLRSKTKISWKYIWKTYHLQQGLQTMKDNNDCPWYEQISRQETLTSACRNLDLFRHEFHVNQLDHILIDHKHRLLYCYVPKVACTNWKRVLMVLTDRINVTNLMEIPASLAHSNSSLTRLSEYNHKQAEYYLKHYISFLIVRQPFERVLSAYRNKLEDTLPSAKYFQARIGRYIIKNYRPNATKIDMENGDNVTFREFVQYLIKEGIKNDIANEHWKPIYELCYPCIVNYTFIGKYEYIDVDSDVILNMVNAPPISFPHSRSGQTSEKLKLYLRQLSLSDIVALYRMYELDFKLFGYDLENILGFDIG
ncbi:hypothetical protein FQA39_LY16271 [Lamprigera yunnana]|nr:hypothetical protein FQA39_LY16271 [Lamprigera yunnana]